MITSLKPNSKKVHLTYTLTDIHRVYWRERKNDPTRLESVKFRRIAMRLLYLISVAIIRENYVFIPPGRLGVFGIQKQKGSKKHKVDYQASKLAGKRIKHLNRHSAWHYFRLAWVKTKLQYCQFTNKWLYSFEPVRDEKRREVGKRGLAQWIQELYKDPHRKDYDALHKFI